MMNVHKLVFFVIFSVLFSVGTAANYPQLTNIPTVYINTTNSAPINSKETYVPGKLVVVSSDSKEELLGTGSGVPIEIRGRGNSSWSWGDKKPYRIKFETKTNFLNLPAKAKSWTLLANFFDKSLIRNAVAMKISELVGLEFTPAARFVDLVLNGVYVGTYMVSDQVEVRENRVDVEEQDANTTTLPNLSGGYLIEIDGFAESEPVWFSTGKGLKITVKYPENDGSVRVNSQQLSYIKSFTQRFETALFSSNFKDPALGYRALVDTESLVNWYIGCELTGNSDSFWSTYLYKRRNIDKFFFGPMWDYDIAFNNDNRLGNATEKLMRNDAHDFKAWIQQLWKDEWFRGAVYRKWMQLIDDKIIDKLIVYIDETTALIDASQKKNYQIWPINTQAHVQQHVFNNYTGYVNYLKTYLAQRADFLTRSFTADRPVEPSLPFVADNFYYKILNVGSNNAIQIQNQSDNVNAKLELWTPQSNNNYQEWNILPIANNKFQIINRKSGLAITGNGRGNNLIQTNPNASNTAQQWAITPVNTGDIYGLVNTQTGYSMNNSGGNTSNGAAAIEWDNNIAGSQNQQWYFRKTDKIVTSNLNSNEENKILVYVQDNSLIINHLKGQNRISIYTIMGQFIYSSIVEDSQFIYRLKAGCYIVSVQGNSQYRVIIK